jgi:hypothetical protein
MADEQRVLRRKSLRAQVSFVLAVVIIALVALPTVGQGI